MASALSQMRFVLWCGFALCVVGAFSVHRFRGERNVQGRGLPVRTKYLQLRDNIGDASSAVSAAAAAISALMQAFPSAKKALQELYFKLPNATTSFPILDGYVSRPALESRILKVYNSSRESDSYTVIVGSKGTGKSSLVAHVLNGKVGVLHFEVSEADTEKSILRRVLRRSGEEVEDNVSDLTLSVLYPVFKQAAKEGGGRRITIVFEIERSGLSEGVLYMVKSVAKKLAIVANVIVILSEANAGLIFGDDLRQKFIWVDGMTNEEATTYAKKLFPAIDDGDLELLFDKVGTFPVVVRDFAEALESGGTAADFIESILLAAETDVAGFTHQPILKMLKASPDGIRTVKFKGVKHEGVNLAEPRDVAIAMKKRNAIVYHLPSGEYRMASRAHRTALLEWYDPVEDNL